MTPKEEIEKAIERSYEKPKHLKPDFPDARISFHNPKIWLNSLIKTKGGRFL